MDAQIDLPTPGQTCRCGRRRLVVTPIEALTVDQDLQTPKDTRRAWSFETGFMVVTWMATIANDHSPEIKQVVFHGLPRSC